MPDLDPLFSRTQAEATTMAKLSRPRLLAFIDSRTEQVQPKTKTRRRNNDEKGSTQRGGPPGGRQRSAAYVYAIIVDGVVRYIGKGRNGRMYTHLIEAKRTSARYPRGTPHLSPRMHRKLVEALRAGSRITETHIGLDRPGRLPTREQDDRRIS